MSESAELDHVYYNVVINNTGNTVMDAKYLETRSQPIFDDDPSKWHGSIVNMKIPGDNIPIFIARPQPGTPTTGNTNPNLTIYSVSITYLAGSTPEEFIIYVPNINVAPLPHSWLTIDQSNFDYYSVFSYLQFMDMINTALASCFGTASLLFPLSPPVLAASPPPRLIFDSATGLFSLIAEDSFNSDGPPTMKIFFNKALFDFFINFRANFIVGSTVGHDREILVRNYHNNYFTDIMFPGKTFFQMQQEYEALEYWSDFQDIVVMSSLIPAHKEYVPIKNVSGNTSRITENNTYPIILDFKPKVSFGADIRKELVYQPTAEFRYFTLESSTPIMQADFSLFWVDRNYDIFPIRIPRKDNISIKVLFKKKDVAKEDD